MPPDQEKKPLKKFAPRPKGAGWLFYALILGMALVFYLTAKNKTTQEISWNSFKNEMLLQHDVDHLEVVNKETVEVYIKKDSIRKPRYRDIAKQYAKGYTDQPQYYFTIGSVDIFEQRMDAAQSGFREADKVSIAYSKRESFLPGLLTWLIPIGMLLLFFYFMRRAVPGGGGGSPFDFAKGRDSEYKGKLSPVTFKDVAGYDEAKTEVMEIVEFLKQPETFTRLGAKIPKGVLLVGPPGSGKTLMAKAVAGEAAVPFFSLSGSEFIEIFVGVGASRVRDLFNKAKQKAPSIIFIDEIDTIGRSRGRAISAQANDERDSTLNQLLTEMDGFDPNTGVIVMAATNRADILDPALLRAGRFDRHIYLELPNKVEREAIFQVHLRPLKIDDTVNAEFLAGQTPGFSGADIANVCNEAALIAARHKSATVGRQDFFEAIDRVVAGLEKKSKIITPAEKKIIAYHEAGHAITGWMLKHVDPLIKVSIIPRGKSLGSAWYMPEEHQIITLGQFKDRMCMALGGRVAEEIIFNEPSSGALDDLEKVTKQAYMMVASLGLSSRLGSISFYDSTGSYESSLQKPFSEATAQLIDSEVQKLVAEARQRTEDILRAKRAELDKLAQLLLDKEIVYKEDIEQIMGKRGV